MLSLILRDQNFVDDSSDIENVAEFFFLAWAKKQIINGIKKTNENNSNMMEEQNKGSGNIFKNNISLQYISSLN